MWTLLAAALLSSPQSDWERSYRCWERDVGDPCWADVRALYAAEPIEQLQRRGMRVRRIFLLDGIGRINRDGRGHGTQAGMISLEQAGNGAPVLIYRPAYGRPQAGRTLMMPYPREDWAAVLTATADMQDESAINWDGCMHGWSFLIESADPGAGGRIVRHVESSCRNGGGLWLAERLTQFAERGLAPCGTALRDELWFRVDYMYRCSLWGQGRP